MGSLSRQRTHLNPNSKGQKMKTFCLTYSLIGSGVVEIVARNEEEAKELLFNMSQEELIEAADFSDGIVVD
jgi:hypothetical protein